MFEDFVDHLLPHCGRWPELHSVLIMDNASFHRGGKIRQKCDAAGVKLIYLSPYSPDFNPAEQTFAQLKAFSKKHFHKYVQDPSQGFRQYLQWCVDVVGSDRKSARGHFRHGGITDGKDNAKHVQPVLIVTCEASMRAASTNAWNE